MIENPCEGQYDGPTFGWGKKRRQGSDSAGSAMALSRWSATLAGRPFATSCDCTATRAPPLAICKCVGPCPLAAGNAALRCTLRVRACRRKTVQSPHSRIRRRCLRQRSRIRRYGIVRIARQPPSASVRSERHENTTKSHWYEISPYQPTHYRPYFRPLVRGNLEILSESRKSPVCTG